MIKWFVLRWRLEVTLHEVREHLGVETQRQWSDLATTKRVDHARFAGAVLAGDAHGSSARQTLQTSHPPSGLVPQVPADLQRCFGAGVKARFAWQHECFPSVASPSDSLKLSPAIHNRLLSALCYTP